MGNSKYLDSLSAEQKNELRKKLFQIQDGKCFICEEPINNELQHVDIDHIKPLSQGGKDAESNFALTHDKCNKEKQDSDLEVAKCIARLNKIIKGAEDNNEIASLKHVLRENGGSKYKFNYSIKGDEILYQFDEIHGNKIYSSVIFTDKLSGEKSAFIEVPIEYLYHDDIINPRGINGSINLLIKEFYKPNPQLHVCLATLNEDEKKIKIFDGQHKAVAQIMLGSRKLVIRLFIFPDIKRLTETNTNAGSKLKQVAFDKSIIRQLHDTLYKEKINIYRKDHNLSDDNFSFSENDLIDYFKGEKRSIKTYIVNSQKNIVTHNQNNKMQPFINFEGKSTDLPISYNTFEKTLLSIFIDTKKVLQTPLDYKLEEGSNPRELEKEQLIKLCNIIAEEILINKYDIEEGNHKIESKIVQGDGKQIKDDHLIACRILKEEIMYNWVKILKQSVIYQYFITTGIYIDENNLFQEKFNDILWNNIRNFIRSFKDLPIWKNKSLSSTVFGTKQSREYWSTVFKTGKTPDGIQILSSPINTNEMIKS